jgi:hypothetical protein
MYHITTLPGGVTERRYLRQQRLQEYGSLLIFGSGEKFYLYKIKKGGRVVAFFDWFFVYFC